MQRYIAKEKEAGIHVSDALTRNGLNLDLLPVLRMSIPSESGFPNKEGDSMDHKEYKWEIR